MKKLEIEVTNVLGKGSGLTITAGDRELTLYSSGTDSPLTNEFVGGASAFNSASAIADAINVNNAAYGSLGPISVDYDDDEFVYITFVDESVTTASVTSLGGSFLSASLVTDVPSSDFNYDKKINVRSPHFYEVASTDYSDIDRAELHIFVYQGTRYSDRPTMPTYVLRSSARLSDRSRMSFNISEFAKSFTEVALADSGTEANWTPFVDIFPYYTSNGTTKSLNPDFGIAYKGYGYFEDGVNPQNSKGIAISNDVILTESNSSVQVPVDPALVSRIVFESNGETVKIENINEDVTYSTMGLTSRDSGSGVTSTYEAKALTSNAEYYENAQLTEFLASHQLGLADKIYAERRDGNVEVIDVKYTSECKHEPVRLTFTNKFGAFQSVWFYKNSSVSMKVKEDSFRRNTLNSSNNSYLTTEHQNKNLYKTGKQSIKLNSGFYPETYNEVFRQMMLSEDVWIHYEGKVLPVNITNSNFDFKTSVNDKLIQYSIKCDFAFDAINSIN